MCQAICKALEILQQTEDSFPAFTQLILVKWYDVVKIQVLMYVKYSATKLKISDRYFHVPVLWTEHQEHPALHMLNLSNKVY